MSSNRIFNVNGRMDRGGKELLLATLKLAFLRVGQETKATGYRLSKTHGFILYQYDGKAGVVPFACPLNADQVYEQVLAWLETDPDVVLTGWDRDADHDGHNGPGWRVYCEDGGHVDGAYAAFLAIKPAFMWYGK